MTESLDSSEDDAFDNKFYLRPVDRRGRYSDQKRIKTVSESVDDRTPPRYEAPWPPGAIVGKFVQLRICC